MLMVAAESNPLAFAAIYERHVRTALALALHICSRQAVAEEIVQEAFLSLWRSRRQYDHSRGQVRPWLLWTVRNRAIDALRQSVSQESSETASPAIDELFTARERTDQEARRREQGREVLAALDGLPNEQSLVLTLAYYGGYTQAEIASMLDTPLGTVKGRMRLGLRKMGEGALALA